MHRSLVLVLTSIVLLGACGMEVSPESADRDGELETVAGTGANTMPTTEPDPITTTETTAPAVVTTPSTTTTTERTPPFDGHLVGSLGVVGVAHDDVLNLRRGPGADHEILAELPPLTDGLVEIGDWTTSVSGWHQVAIGGQVGWVHGRYIAHLGRASSFDDRVSPHLEESTAVDLALRIGEGRTEEDRRSGEGWTDVVIVDLPAAGSDGPITVDAVGMMDDARTGERLRIWTEPTAGGVGWSRIDLIPLCSRGVSREGHCLRAV